MSQIYIQVLTIRNKTSNIINVNFTEEKDSFKNRFQIQLWKFWVAHGKL